MPELSGPLRPGATIGMMGGGQLGRMAAVAAARLGYRVHVFTPEADSPAAQVSAAATVAEWSDSEALGRFAASVDVVTFEFENVPGDALDLLAARVPVAPSPRVLRVSQDRIAEKTFLAEAGVATGPWAPVTAQAQAAAAIAAVGLPCVLKTTRLGYDGKGQATLRRADELAPALGKLAGQDGSFRPLVAEAFIDFACEVSVIVARDRAGTIAAYDTVENRHRNHILDLTIAPARVASAVAEAAQSAARRVAEAIGLVGLLCIEFFVTQDGRVLANEIAPRPHNSGHWTIEACAVSQFEQQVRAVAGLPLGDPSRHSDAVMKNLIGDEIGAVPALLATPGLVPHHYGKAEARPGRKMGHVTRLFPRGGLPDETGIAAAFAPAP
ncbi:5-(carboxyamino)imidazole ribonucleotide synthase [Elioraea rosea]|uniref:5-(carboxyamino)imidazole ribonucleotide synthase n=1 Tax=Elioraea rosea TaxID=2492390 RepID=UPI0019513782|nr:5-(carboxyamino)imidazole ribonucleotide synthase [Elioraea rosea]